MSKLSSKFAALRGPVTYSTSDVKVDDVAGVIYGAACMSIGPASGHGFSLDQTSLEQLAAIINAAPDGFGLKCRFTHPEADENGVEADDLASTIGRVRNARLEGDTVRVDLHLADYSAVMPVLGDVRTFLLQKAKEDPTSFGLSAAIFFDAEPDMDADGNINAINARIRDCKAVDVVGDPAANRNGLLSAGSGNARLFAGLSSKDAGALMVALREQGYDPFSKHDAPEVLASVLAMRSALDSGRRIGLSERDRLTALRLTGHSLRAYGRPETDAVAAYLGIATASALEAYLSEKKFSWGSGSKRHWPHPGGAIASMSDDALSLCHAVAQGQADHSDPAHNAIKSGMTPMGRAVLKEAAGGHEQLADMLAEEHAARGLADLDDAEDLDAGDTDDGAPQPEPEPFDDNIDRALDADPDDLSALDADSDDLSAEDQTDDMLHSQDQDAAAIQAWAAAGFPDGQFDPGNGLPKVCCLPGRSLAEKQAWFKTWQGDED